MQKIEHENLKQLFANVDTMLNIIEVKGDSVLHLYNARKLVKDIFSLIQDVEEEKHIEKTGEE